MRHKITLAFFLSRIQWLAQTPKTRVINHFIIFNGTLKSTRTNTRLPASERWFLMDLIDLVDIFCYISLVGEVGRVSVR